MPLETVIVGGRSSKFHYANGGSRSMTIPEQSIQAVALVFVKDMNKPHGNFKQSLIHIYFQFDLVPFCLSSGF